MNAASKSESKRQAVAEQQSGRRAVSAAANEAVFAGMDDRAAQHFFSKRGLSADSIRVLIAHGIEMPEELLLATESELLQIDGLEEAGLAEVKAYRRRFIDKDG